jgi:hypothetical protein
MNFILLTINTILIAYIIRDYATKVFPNRNKFKVGDVVIQNMPDTVEPWNAKDFTPDVFKILECGKYEYLVHYLNDDISFNYDCGVSKKHVNSNYRLAPETVLNNIIEGK